MLFSPDADATVCCSAYFESRTMSVAFCQHCCNHDRFGIYLSLITANYMPLFRTLHVDRKGDAHWVRQCMIAEIERYRQGGGGMPEDDLVGLCHRGYEEFLPVP